MAAANDNLQRQQQLQQERTNESNNNHQEMNSFLETMTFAQQQLDSNSRSLYCDCDDCETLPALFRDAIRQHKRRKRENDTIVSFKRTQERRLLQRCENGMSIWEWTVPVGAEPLIEFGNSHRLVLVRSLSEHARIRALGNGVVGSYDEESTRKDTRWEEKGAYFIPSNGGTAVGWIQTRNVTSLSASGDSKPPLFGNAILIMFKIPTLQLMPEVLEQRGDGDCDENDPASFTVAMPPWAETVRRLCREALDQEPKPEAGFVASLPAEDVRVLCNILDDIL